jgi:hypothetical protein
MLKRNLRWRNMCMAWELSLSWPYTIRERLYRLIVEECHNRAQRAINLLKRYPRSR